MKRRFQDTDGKHDETIKRRSRRQAVRAKKEPSDVVCQKEGSTRPAGEAPTILQQNDENVSEKAPSYLFEFEEIPMRFARQGDGPSASQLVDLLASTSFKMKMLKQDIKSLADFEDVIVRTIKELMKTGQIYRVLVRGRNEKKDGCGVQYVKDVTEVLQKQV